MVPGPRSGMFLSPSCCTCRLSIPLSAQVVQVIQSLNIHYAIILIQSHFPSITRPTQASSAPRTVWAQRVSIAARIPVSLPQNGLPPGRSG